ncbi:hypothetical protein C1646_759978 [Rhizophagus diaphanus]|nr:hypothetical protein C1646_759978 [Rhizophagus diaphanus] [Rhizophagus sp. MUCL 43196]
MVHPYMCMLKRMYAPRANENETVESYLELIYGPLIPENEEENAEDDISDSSSVKRGRGRGLGRSRSRGHSHGGHSHILQRPNNEIEDIIQVEYLPPVNNLEGIHKKNEKLPICGSLHREEQKTQAESLLSNLYTQLKNDLKLPEDVRSPILDDDDDIF